MILHHGISVHHETVTTPTSRDALCLRHRVAFLCLRQRTAIDKALILPDRALICGQPVMRDMNKKIVRESSLGQNPELLERGSYTPSTIPS